MRMLAKAMHVMTVIGLVTLLSGCLGRDSEGRASATIDAMRQPMGRLAGAVSKHGAPDPVIAAARDVVATYEAGLNQE